MIDWSRSVNILIQSAPLLLGIQTGMICELEAVGVDLSPCFHLYIHYQSSLDIITTRDNVYLTLLPAIINQEIYLTFLNLSGRSKTQ